MAIVEHEVGVLVDPVTQHDQTSSIQMLDDGYVVVAEDDGIGLSLQKMIGGLGVDGPVLIVCSTSSGFGLMRSPLSELHTQIGMQPPEEPNTQRVFQDSATEPKGKVLTKLISVGDENGMTLGLDGDGSTRQIEADLVGQIPSDPDVVVAGQAHDAKPALYGCIQFEDDAGTGGGNRAFVFEPEIEEITDDVERIRLGPYVSQERDEGVFLLTRVPPGNRFTQMDVGYEVDGFGQTGPPEKWLPRGR